ncbi:hypothetical protein MMK62_004464 [Pseudomonas aeruginosa]|uniref:hypothetical protein n=1 Tax=Pseudomonas aeruginosa TaxID=287 RepID=UPI00071B0381|nr:hypothetical protein [Pseudomonas aeruginosa]EIU4987538.1 hypothetical protein [Pseudomonas aeruginosa]EIY2609963.1 hypothetical protein [Pseudomonas aeruginosa]EIY2741368.1 hypothetical protein [Pseudomonas aeruginosa]EKM0197036.1 hypothetical protein [Pseudomonas aeruginosa]EKM0220165.1 hypothetical protein [Pseudomonas aeruginosa]
MNSRHQFEHRVNTQIIDLSEVMREFAEPELLRLQISPKVKKKPLDIGSLAYFIRGKNESIHDDRGTPVVTGSLVKSRRALIAKLVESFVGRRDSSVLNRFVHAEFFVDWLNGNGYREIFSSALDAQKAYREFTAHLNHQVAHQLIKPLTARAYQWGAVKIIELLYPENSHQILVGAVKIVARGGSAAASATHVELYRDVCFAIARQCANFVLNKNSYPFVVNIRDYEVVVFPSNVGAVGPFKECPSSYSAAERRIATVEEYLAGYDKVGRKRSGKSLAARDLKDAQNSLDAANGNERHWHRLEVAGLAAKAYACLFLMITGATPTEFAQFSYADALEVEKSPIKKELSAVKFRAGGKSTLYNIGRDTGLTLLKEYLKLREWILNGASHERLFFAMPSAAKRTVSDSSFSEINVTNMVTKFYRSTSGAFLDPNVPRLSPRQMRKHKSIGMHTAGVALGTVAASLNHSEQMNISTYAEATPEQMEAELGTFWQAMHHAANIVRERSEKATGDEIATAAGHCDGFNQPIPVRDLEAIAIEPNCRTQYGCLYCEHYLLHSDEEDFHKLLSLQYVINAVRRVAPDAAHAEALYKDLSLRVEFILGALGERSDSVKQTVETVKARVFEYGELTPFWESRLSHYEKMGVVF